MVSDVVN